MRRFLAPAFLFACLTSFSADWDGTILPSSDVPDFVKARWSEIAKQTWLPFDKRCWPKPGLPEGLEEQVWKAWAPGAPQVWRNISPGYANVVYDAKVDGGVATLVLDGAGLVQSKDGGATWRALSHHLTVPSRGFFSFDISPADSKRIVVAGGRLDRSLDGGRSWSLVHDKAFPAFGYDLQSSFGAVRFNADGSRLFAGLGAFGHGVGGPRGDVEDLMAKSFSRKILYVGDGEASSFKALELDAPFAGIRCLVPSRTNPNLLYATFADGSIYRSSNAVSATPSFEKLELPEAFAGLQAISLDISPDSADELLLVLHGEKGKSKLLLAKLSGKSLNCRVVDVPGARGTLASAFWNPRDSRQALVGFAGMHGFCLSDDGLKSFRIVPFPDSLKHGEGGFYCDPHKFAFDAKSDLILAWSCIGAWSTRDFFKNVDDLLMSYDDAKKLYGNKGSGFAECAVSIDIRKGSTYISTNDHGAFRSDGSDLSKWRKISANPGMPKGPKGEPFAGLCFPMGVAEDESAVLLFARMGYLHPGKTSNNMPFPYSDDHLKLMLSSDKGETWSDITDRFGKGDEISLAQTPIKIVFDPSDAKRAWLLFRKSLFRTLDGCESFQECAPDVFKALPMLDLAFDAKHGILYANGGGGASVKLLRSFDFGATWKELSFDLEPKRVATFGVLGDGSLALGAEGRLFVVPFEKIDSGVLAPSMLRLSVGDSVASFAAAQRDFRPIVCDGMNILVFPSNGFRASNCARPLGPLLSVDGGKTFNWIVSDLPCVEGRKAAMRDGRVIVGNTGIYERTFK